MIAWEFAATPHEVHALVEASDRAAAERYGTPPPRRRADSTRFLVGAGSVSLGRCEGIAVVTVTVGPTASFNPAEAGLPDLDEPWYMQRLAVLPGAADPLLGLQAVRRAITLARDAGASGLRAEANPDLTEALAMLTRLGFRRGATEDSSPARRTFLQLTW